MSFIRTSLVYLLLNVMTIAQSSDSSYQFLSPFPGGAHNSPECIIVVRHGDVIEPGSVANSITVVSALTGSVPGSIIPANDGKTLNFKADQPFTKGDSITVKISSLYNSAGIKLPDQQFWFKVKKEKPPEAGQSIENQLVTQNMSSVTGLPSGYPVPVLLTKSNPSDGFFFYGTFKYTGSSFMVIADNNLNPVFYRNIKSYDFKVLNNGTLCYLDKSTNDFTFYVMDSLYRVIDSVDAIGYPTDDHEVRRLENGNWLIYGRNYFWYDMRQVVEGGDSTAYIVDMVIQELDSSKNLLFEWKYFDHLPPTDIANNHPLTHSTLDLFHPNALETDNDGHILSSTRNYNEITKINRQTGEVIWRLGGNGSDFTFGSQEAVFDHQHHIRVLKDGSYTLFDNAWDNKISSALRFTVDTSLMVCNLINIETTKDPAGRQVYGSLQGSYAFTPSGNQLISWGWNAALGISELTPSGEPVMEFNITDNLEPTYRIYKYNWRNTLFTADTDSIGFGYVPAEDSASHTIRIISKLDTPLDINQVYSTDSSFFSKTALPVTLQPGDTSEIKIEFKPKLGPKYIDTLYLRSFNEYEGYATPVIVTGSSDSLSTSVNDEQNDKPVQFTLEQNYPNPFNPVTTIGYSLPEESFVVLQLFDITGRTIAKLVEKVKPEGHYEIIFDASDLSSGVYFYRIKANGLESGKKMSSFRKMMLLK